MMLTFSLRYAPRSFCKTAKAGHIPSPDRTTLIICPKNTFSIGANDMCTDCPPGGHSLPGSSSCELCSTGEYFDEAANACGLCPKNTFTLSGATNREGCTPCQNVGEFSKAGAGYCAKCPQYEEFNESAPSSCDCMPSFSRVGDDSSCTCKAGETLMGTSCEPCEKGKWKSSIGVTSCTRCEDTLKGAFTARNGSTSVSSCICPPRTYDDGKGACVPIEEGMSADLAGMTLKSVTLDAGFWRTKEKTDDVRECMTPEACVGGSGDGDEVCREGHTGPYCALCVDNFNLDPFMLCQKCSESWEDFAFTVLFFVLLGLLLFGAYYLLKKKLHREEKGKEMWKRCKNGLKVLFASGEGGREEIAQRSKH